MKVLSAKWIPSKRATRVSGACRAEGSVHVLVDKIPEPVYRIIKAGKGEFFYSEQDGCISVFEHLPNSWNGFGGRLIKLTFEDGTTREFTGTLWDSWTSDSEVPEYFAVSITEEPEVMERGFTFYAGYITRELMESILNEFLSDESVEMESSACRSLTK